MNMVIKIRFGWTPECEASAGRPISNAESWHYYEDGEITVHCFASFSLDAMRSQPSLCIDIPEDKKEIPCYCVKSTNHNNLFFNTEAFLLNDKGKTIDHFLELPDLKHL
jgi:hypothetical protein